MASFPKEDLYYQQEAPRNSVPAEPQKIRLSTEELKVLRECNRESFYYRCLPYSSVAMVATHLAVSKGYLRPNGRWGSTFKVLGAGLIGFVAGKFSYQKKCVEKILQLPNSTLGDALRNRGKKGVNESIDLDVNTYFGIGGAPPLADETMAERAGAGNTGAASAHHPYERSDRSGVDLDKSIVYKELNDSFRPTVDNPNRANDDEIPQLGKAAGTNTYEDLRTRNRKEYEQKMRELYQRREPPAATPPPRPPPVPPQSKYSKRDDGSFGQKKGKYGDVWDDD